MADWVLQLLLLSLSFIVISAEEDNNCSGHWIGIIVGSTLAGAAVIELVTIVIAVCCCVSLKRKLNKSASFAKSAHEQSSARSRHSRRDKYDKDEDDDIDPSKTIRVVRNTLYESMKSESGKPMTPTLSPTDTANGAPTSDISAEQAGLMAQLQPPGEVAGPRTQSSHTYEAIDLEFSKGAKKKETPPPEPDEHNGHS